MTRTLAILVAVGAVAAPAVVRAQPGSGFIGKRDLRLLIDDCPAKPDVALARLRALPGEHFLRGTVLYEQGDYQGAAAEFLRAYCLAPCFGVLKDVGAAFERQLEYETAIAYYERYVRTMPERGEKACRPVPPGEELTMKSRITVLSRLQAQIQIATTPPGAKVTLSDDDTGVRSLGVANGKIIEALAGVYTMTVVLEGYETVTQRIEVRIGKPYSYFFPLERLRGRLKVRTTPPDARITLDGKMVGQGLYDDELARGSYELLVEAPGRIADRRRVEVSPGTTTEHAIELPPPRASGRLQLVVASGVVGATLGGVGLSAGSQNPLILGVGSFGAAAAAVAGGYFGIPDDYPLGSSSFIITTSLAGAGEALLVTQLFSSDPELQTAMTSIGVIAGGTAAALTADYLDFTPGDAALLNTGWLWGTVVGALFAASYDDGTPYGRRLAAGLTLTGLNIGVLGGVLLGRNYEISRRHAALIDLAGVAGAATAAALQSVIDTNEPEVPVERRANFAIGGVAVGLLAGAILTRNMDVPRLPRFKPTVVPITAPDGTVHIGIGISGDL